MKNHLEKVTSVFGKNFFFTLLCGMIFLNSGCRETTNTTPLKTVSHVDLNRYLGTWYEIASYPNRFQKGCSATTATYSQQKDNKKIAVVNRCYRNNKWDEVSGVASVVPNSGNAKLKVSFFWPFYGAYWIIDLEPNYEYAVVGHPSRQYLWILARKPYMEPDKYAKVLTLIQTQGFESNRLVRTDQTRNFAL